MLRSFPLKMTRGISHNVRAFFSIARMNKNIFKINTNRMMFTEATRQTDKDSSTDKPSQEDIQNSTKEEKQEATSDKTSNSKSTNEESKNQADDKELKALTQKYKELEKTLKEEKEKIDSLNSKYIQVRKAYLDNEQEFEQIKGRHAKEVNNTKEFAISKFAKDLLDVHDNFGRAMNAVGEKPFSELSEEEKVEAFNNFVEGTTHY